MKKNVFIFFLLLMTALAFLPQPVKADSSSYTLHPAEIDEDNPKTRSWFILTLSPGQQLKQEIVIENHAKTELKLRFYPTDSTTTSQGDFTLELEDESRDFVGNWITLDQKEITVPAASSKRVSFTIKVPDDAPVGDWSGGVVFQEANTQELENKEGVQIKIVERVGIRVYVSVPGERIDKLEVASFDNSVLDGFLGYTTTLNNEGNTIVNPSARLSVTDLFGKTEVITHEKPGDVYPKKSRQLVFKTNSPKPWLNRHIAKLTVTFNGKEVTSEHTFYYIHPVIVGVGLFIILAAIVFFFFRKKSGATLKTTANQVIKDIKTENLKDGVVDENEEEIEQAALYVAHHIKFMGVLLILGFTLFTALLTCFIYFIVIKHVL